MITTNTLVIGGGPGGYAAAIRLGQLGIDTVLVEKNKLGGTCLNVGCIPSKALLNAAGKFYSLKNDFSNLGIEAKEGKIDWVKTIAWKDQLVQKIVSGVEMLVKANQAKLILAACVQLKQNEAILSNQEVVRFQNVILAMGSSVLELPAFPFDHKMILDSTDLLNLKTPPKSLLVLGGGIIGMELSTVYLSLGTKVKIVEMLPNILPTYEKEATSLIQKSFEQMGGEILLHAKALKVKKEKDFVELEVEIFSEDKTTSQITKIQAEKMAVAVGRKPALENIDFSSLHLELEGTRFVVNEKMQTNLPHVYAIGDIAPGPMLAHKATMEGVLAAEAIAGKKVSRKDVKVIPDVVYTKPEIAQVGISLEQAQQKGVKVKVGKFPLAALGMAATNLESKGYVKYIAEEETNRILGAVIVATKASDLIAESALAIEMGANLEDVALTVHAHPSYSEAHMEAAAHALKHAIHILNR